jgi:hypothetical protein
MRDKNVRILGELSGFDSESIRIAEKLYKNISLGERDCDLLPQATIIACLAVGEIIKTGGRKTSKMVELAKKCSINFNSILIRFPVLHDKNNYEITDDSGLNVIGLAPLKRATAANSPRVIKFPSWQTDADFNIRDRWSDLHSTYSSIPAKHIKTAIPDSRWADFYYEHYKRASHSVTIHLVLLSQAIQFTEESDLEKFRNDAEFIGRIYMRKNMQYIVKMQDARMEFNRILLLDKDDNGV